MSQATSVSKEKQERPKRNQDSITGDATKLAQAANQLAERSRLVEARIEKKFARLWGIFGAARILEANSQFLRVSASVTDDDRKFMVETGGPKSLLKKGDEK